jgi:hypothetical protein
VCECASLFPICNYFTSNHIVTYWFQIFNHSLYIVTEKASFQCSDKVQLTVLTKWPHSTVVVQSWVMSFCCITWEYVMFRKALHVPSSM